MAEVRVRDSLAHGRKRGDRLGVRRILRVRAVGGLHRELSVAGGLGQQHLLGVDVEDQLARRAHAGLWPEVEIPIGEPGDCANRDAVDQIEVVAAGEQQRSGHFAAGTFPTSSMLNPPGSFTNTFRTVGLQFTSSPLREMTRTPFAFIRASRSAIDATRIAIPDDPGSGTRIENGLRGMPLNSTSSMRA